MLLSMASGYILFLAVFPSVAFPRSAEPSLTFLLLALPAALVVGFASDDFALGLSAVMSSVFGGVLLATLMALSPILYGVQFFDPGSVTGFLVHYGFVYILMTLVVNMTAVLVGYAVRERVIFAHPLPRLD
jgi:hypothetical protein